MRVLDDNLKTKKYIQKSILGRMLVTATVDKIQESVHASSFTQNENEHFIFHTESST